MKFILHLSLALGFALGALPAGAQSESGDLFIYLKDGTLDVVPDSLVKSRTSVDGEWQITLRNDSVLHYDAALVDRISDEGPATLPKFTSFKFNNKYNDQVFTDVIATLVDDTHITATVGAIGKRLTPSFRIDDAEGVAFIGSERQESKVSRPRFDGDVVYTLGHEGWRTMDYLKISDELWSSGDDEYKTEKVALTESMLSTNAPSNYPETEGLAMMLDGNSSTFFHSTWGTGSYEKLPQNQNTYIDVALPEPLQSFNFYYMTRPGANRLPTSWSIQVSHDGTNWTEVLKLDQSNGLPTSMSQEYTSPVIETTEAYEYVRLEQTGSSYKNYLCLAELALYKVTKIEGEGPTLIHPAEYAYEWRPYGRQVTVSVDWLTDHATQVPRIDLNVEGGQLISSKEVYLNAEIIIDGAGVFPDFRDSVQVKGRGNTSWQGAYGKSPYRLKFAAKKAPFGLTKGKSWVLLANNQTGSMMTNALAMKVAQLAGTASANHIIPVELYLNGEYRGSYNFTEHIGFSNNSVDIEDESHATLLELDSYYDETYKFRDNAYYLPVNIKDPDFTEAYDQDYLDLIQSDFNEFTSLVSRADESYTDKMDVEMFARFMFVNMYVHNCELGHPKSCYVYREDLRALHAPYIFGPVWDFDWAYGYDGSYVYYINKARSNYFSSISSGTGGQFYTAVTRNSDKVQKALYRVWTNFLRDHQQEILEFVDDYYQYANPSFLHNAERWSDGRDYASSVENMKSWLQEHAEYAYSTLQAYDLETPETISVGDVNLDGAITAADAVCVMNYLVGLSNESFDAKQADADGSGAVSISDAVRIVAMAMRQPALLSRQISLPAAAADLRWNRFALTPGMETLAQVQLNVEEADYAAAQFDVVLPEGMQLTNISLPQGWEGNSVSFAAIATAGKSDGNRYRVIVSGSGDRLLPVGNATLGMYLQAESLIPEATRVVSIEAATLVNRLGEDLRLAPKSTSFDMETTGISGAVEMDVKGGDGALDVESLGEGTLRIYTPDGRLLRTASVTAGRQSVALPTGIYIVNHRKVIVK